MEFLYLLESIRTPFLDSFMSFITHGGSELVFMLTALILFWCVDKKLGYYVLTVGFFGTAINQVCKLAFRVPRPWILDPEFTIVESARADATGYSFPSGHTQTSVGTFSCLIIRLKNKVLRGICLFLILLVPFSRMYLGVHTPLDVGVAFITAVMLAVVFHYLMDKACKTPHGMEILLAVMLAVCAAYLVYVSFYPFPADIDPTNLQAGTKNAYTLTGAMLGLLAAYMLDKRILRFSVTGTTTFQIFKVIGGIALVLAVKEGLKPILSAIGFGINGSSLIRYCLVAVTAGYLWPLLFTYIARSHVAKD